MIKAHEEKPKLVKTTHCYKGKWCGLNDFHIDLFPSGDCLLLPT